MLGVYLKGICAGLLIAIGGCVYLGCDNKYVGAVMFSVALLCICSKGYVLFTGKVGYIPEDHSKKNIAELMIGLLGNLTATVIFGLLVRYAMPSLGDAANTICLAKLTQTVPQTLVRGFFCGILMYLAVSIYREKSTYLSILFCVPVFILSGFEHSIADMFYFAASGVYNLNVILFLAVVIVGNSVGGMVLPLLTGAWRAKNANEN